MPLRDYAHWNEDAEYMWWHEEGKHVEEPPEPDYDLMMDIEQDREYEAYMEEAYQEHLRLEAEPKVKGCSAVAFDSECESCGETRPVVYGRDVYTLGYPGHPGAEITVFHVCKECLESR